MSKAIDDVIAERKRQIETEGWTSEHDDEHDNGEMAQAASVYALCAATDRAERSVMDAFCDAKSVPYRIHSLWPWDLSWLKPKNRRRDLVRAAALVIAEIERLDRKGAMEKAHDSLNT